VFDLKIPFVSYRYSVNTKYEFHSYGGKKDEYLVLMSSQGNDHLWGAETLGKDIQDGRKVKAFNEIDGYYIRPNPDGGCRLTYLIVSESTALPDWIFKKIGPKMMATGCKKVIEKVKQLCKE
jgi:hypothetical protein